MGLTVKKDRTVHVRAPFWLSSSEVIRMVSGKASWIRSRQQALEKEQVLPPSGPELNRIKKQAELKFHTIASPWVEHFREQYNVSPKRWTIRNMNTRWGSCSKSTGRITLNLKLFYKPDACIEYIIVHELCHLIHPDHGKKLLCLAAKGASGLESKKKTIKSLTLCHYDIQRGQL